MGGTMNSQNGRVFLPSVEPFGKTLRDQILDRVVTPVRLEFHPTDRAPAQGGGPARPVPWPVSLGSEIMLNALNCSRGFHVTVIGGARLTESPGYVDYNLGQHHQRRPAEAASVSLENAACSASNKAGCSASFGYIERRSLTPSSICGNPLTQGQHRLVNNTII